MPYYTALQSAWNGTTQPPTGVTGTGLTAGMTTAQKLAAVNAWTVAGSNVDVAPSQVVRYLGINGKLAGLLKYAATPPATAAGLAAAELAAVLEMGVNAPPFYASQPADYAALQNMLNALAGDANSGLTAADVAALLALAKGPQIAWCQANGYPYSGSGGGLNLNDVAAAGLS